MVLAISLVPICVQSSPQEQRFLKQPIFGDLIFAVDLTLDSMMGGKYRTIDHPYIYINTGDSVKCLEPESGRLAQTVPFDPLIEEPYDATNTGIEFIKTDEKGARFFELTRYDGTQFILPMADNAFMVYWEPKPVVWQIERGSPEGVNLVTAIDENGQTIWKVDGLYDLSRDSSNRYWFRTKDGWYLVDPQTGKAVTTLPDGFGFVHARGSLAYLLHESKEGVSAIFNLETGKLVHECNGCFHTIGKDGFLCYQRQPTKGSRDCFKFNRYSQDGQLLDDYKVNLPHEFSYFNSNVGDFNENLMTVWIPQDSVFKMSIIDIQKNLVVYEITGALGVRFLENDKIFYLTDKNLGCIDTQTLNQIWSMPIGNNPGTDDVFEKDFGNFKLVGRRVFSASRNNGLSLQVKIVDKADDFVEPYEFEFENGGLSNCYETDYGFININDLSRFSIYYPQISFYRRGSLKAVGKIDYIGDINPDTISIKDGRFLIAKLSNKKTVEIDAREMSFRILGD